MLKKKYQAIAVEVEPVNSFSQKVVILTDEKLHPCKKVAKFYQDKDMTAREEDGWIRVSDNIMTKGTESRLRTVTYNIVPVWVSY